VAQCPVLSCCSSASSPFFLIHLHFIWII
jgi:hypothetical protein